MAPCQAGFAEITKIYASGERSACGTAGRNCEARSDPTGGLEVSEARRIRALEDENSMLKKLLAEAMLDRAIAAPLVQAQGRARQKVVAPGIRREAVAHVVAVLGVSQRRACQALGEDRSSVRCRSVRPDDAEAPAAMRAVAAERRRFGYRRIHIMPDRQGIVMNHKKLRRPVG